MKVTGNGTLNWDAGKNKGVRPESTTTSGDKFVSGGNDWTPVKPNVTSAVSNKPSAFRNFSGAMTLALGLALTIGATGCASVATAQSAQRTPIVQTHTKSAQDTTAKPTSYQVGKGLHDIGKGAKEVAQPAVDKGKEVGQEIGKAGKKFGLGVAKEAKSFWKGLTNSKD